MRHDFHGDWTRFHALPDSKRYADTKAEQRVILSRANTLAEACFPEPDNIWIVTANYGIFDLEANDVAIRLGMDRTFSWIVSKGEPEDQIQATFYAAKILWEPFLLDWLFIEIAEDRERAILFAERQRTVLAPYDGGFDIICPQPEKIRALETNFGSWMSDAPDKH